MRTRRSHLPQTRLGRADHSLFAPRIEPLEPRLLMAVWSVINNNDSGAGSLRQAISSAASNDTIKFSTSGQIVLLSPLTISKSMTITGTAGAAPIVLNANMSTNIFDTSGSIALSGRGGAVATGGAASLLLTNCTFDQNQARGGAAPNAPADGSGLGGAIYLAPGAGAINFLNCTIAGNSAIGGTRGRI